MSGKIYLVCKVDKAQMRFSAKQLMWLAEHIYGKRLSECFNIEVSGFRNDLMKIIEKLEANGDKFQIVV